MEIKLDSFFAVLSNDQNFVEDISYIEVKGFHYFYHCVFAEMSVKAQKKSPAAKENGVDKKSKTPMKARPKKKGLIEANKGVRQAIANGDLVKDEIERKNSQDRRTLYVRFPEKQPTSADQIKELHSDIKFVRTPRMAAKKDSGVINYAFVEFGNEDECAAAKKKLSTTQFKGGELFVDFVGEKSKQKKHSDPKDKSQFNPLRLFISGLAPGINNDNLKEMFPKAAHAQIPKSSKKKGTSYGFVQFSNPADAKAAFDAAQDLEISGHRITVLFAKRTMSNDELVAKKKEKAKKRKERMEAKQSPNNPKKLKLESGADVDKEEEAGTDNDEDKSDAAEEAENELKNEKEIDEGGDDDEDENDESDSENEEADDTLPQDASDDGEDDEDDDDDDDDDDGDDNDNDD